MTRTRSSSSTAGVGPTIARHGLLAALFVLGAASCSKLPVNEVAAVGQGPTTTYVTMPPTSAPVTSAPTTSPPSSEPATTAISPSTTAAPTSASTTVVPSSTTAVAEVPATSPPTTGRTTTTLVTGAELEELPYTGPSEAVLFALIGLTMVVAGRTVLDLAGVLSHFNRVGENLPPR